MKLKPGLALFTLVILIGTEAKSATIEDIVSNPESYLDEQVEVEGIVIQYAPATASSTSYYILKGYYGSYIRVNTSGSAPEVNEKYRVKGIVYMNRDKDPFISEQNKIFLSGLRPANPDLSRESDRGQFPVDRLLLLMLLLLLCALGVLFYFKSKTTPADHTPPFRGQSTADGPVNKTIPYKPNSSFSTVTVPISLPNTMKYIPGELIFTKGPDTGKRVKIAGLPGPNGAVTTIGRDQVTGSQQFAHIQIDPQYKTVSRKQAEIIYRDGKIFLCNRADVNFTILNSKTMGVGEMRELKNGDVIRMGEIEFRFAL